MFRSSWNKRSSWYISYLPFQNQQGPVSIWRPSFPGMGISMLKIRWLWDHLIFTIGIPIQVRWHLYIKMGPWPQFYQTRSAWSMDQGSNENHSPVNNFAPTVTKFCVMWEGQALPHDTKLGNCRDKIVDSRVFLSWSLIHGSRWSGLIKLGPGCLETGVKIMPQQNGLHFDDISNETVYILIKCSVNVSNRQNCSTVSGNGLRPSRW